MSLSNEDIIKFIEELNNADNKNDELFCVLITKTLKSFDLRYIEGKLARECGMPRTTVHRWANGVSSPHPLLRKHVYEIIIKEAEELLLKQLAGIYE